MGQSSWFGLTSADIPCCAAVNFSLLLIEREGGVVCFGLSLLIHLPYDKY